MHVPELGVGLVYWPGLEPLFSDGTTPVTSLEVEVESFWFEAPPAQGGYRADRDALRRISQLPQRKVVHGVGFPLGTARSPDPAHLEPLCECIELLDAQWFSTHLAFSRARAEGRGYFTGFMLPPLQTPSNIEAISSTVRAIGERIPVPLLLETGVNYLRRQPWELADGDFVARVADGAQCGILLDLHNIWSNEKNGRGGAREFLGQLPLHRIHEIHLAGGLQYQGFWLDSHSGLVAPEVLDLAREIVPLLPDLGAIHVEILPQFLPAVDMHALRDQLFEVADIWSTRGSKSGARGDARSTPPAAHCGAEPCTGAQWEDTLGALCNGLPVSEHGEWVESLSRDRATALYRDLGRTFRAGVIVDSLKFTSRLLMCSLGREEFRRLLRAFWNGHLPEAFAETECRSFAAWLRDNGPGLPHLDAILDYDLAMLNMAVDGQDKKVRFDCDPMPLLTALGEGHLNAVTPPGDFELVITANDESQATPGSEARTGA